MTPVVNILFALPAALFNTPLSEEFVKLRLTKVLAEPDHGYLDRSVYFCINWILNLKRKMQNKELHFTNTAWVQSTAGSVPCEGPSPHFAHCIHGAQVCQLRGVLDAPSLWRRANQSHNSLSKQTGCCPVVE